jgi:hypothetical protein
MNYINRSDCIKAVRRGFIAAVTGQPAWPGAAQVDYFWHAQTVLQTAHRYLMYLFSVLDCRKRWIAV